MHESSRLGRPASTIAATLGQPSLACRFEPILGGPLVDVRFHATLRQAVGGKHVVVDWHEGLTVWGFVTQMIERYPPLGPQLLDAEGKLARHVHVMVNGRDAPYLVQGMETPLSDTDKIDVFPPVGGG